MNGPEIAVAHARSLVGARWRHQGRKPWAVDCIGLVELSLIAGGWTKPIDVPARYGREPWDDRLRRGLQEHFGSPVVAPWQAGDIALIRWSKGQPTHVGLLADHVHGGISIIHSSNFKGVIETALVGRIHDCVVEVYRPEWGD